MKKPTIPEIKEDCLCLQGNFYYLNFQRTRLGGESQSGEIEILTCKFCGRLWLCVFYEPGVRDDDDRWYAGLIDKESIASIIKGDVLKNTLQYLEALNWYYTGGTYWVAIGHSEPLKHMGKIFLWPY